MAGIEDETEVGSAGASPSLAALAEEWLDEKASSIMSLLAGQVISVWPRKTGHRPTR